MKKNEVMVFENAQLGLRVRTVLNPDGSISVSAEDTAFGFGWTQEKKGRLYPRWETMNGFCKDLGFSQQVGKDEYIPESLYYLLGMKANNEKAQKYQRWLAMEILPTLRKTGSYEVQKKSPLQLLELEFAAIKEVDSKVDAINEDLQDFKRDMPILGIEEGKITSAVSRKGVQCLGGKKSNAYKDNSLRGKLYSDLYRELYRQFGITTYKALKRSQCDMAIQIIEAYKPPLILAEQIADCNAQVKMEVA